MAPRGERRGRRRGGEAAAEDTLTLAGVRPTRQRVDVLEELMEEPDDVTAQELHGRLRGRHGAAGLATVYRTLALLTERGVIDTIFHRAGEVCYRWCREEHHHHLVCSRCHRVVELGDCKLDPWVDRVSAEHGFVPTGHRLEVAGVCASCR